MKSLVSCLVVVGLAATASADPHRFFLHHSVGGVSVPGGTANFYLDETPPAGFAVITEGHPTPRNTSFAFPTFIGQALGADETLATAVDVVVDLSANAAMTACIDLRADIDQVDSGGVRTPLANGTVTGVNVPQGSQNGQVHFRALDIPVTLPSPTVIHTGESIAVTVTLTNNCAANRLIHLAYDAIPAQASATFGGSGGSIPFGGDDPGCIPDTREHLKCADELGRVFAKLGTDVVKCHQKFADATAGGGTFDEEACEEAPVTSAKAKADKVIQKLVTKGICSAELLANAAALEAATLAVLDALDGDVYCDATSGTPFGGDDAGYVPPTRDSARCADAVGKAAGKLMSDVFTCHRKMAKASYEARVFDEEACETTEGGLERFDATRDKLAEQHLCPPCLDSAHIDTLGGTVLPVSDGTVALLYPCLTTTTTSTTTTTGP